MKSTNMGQKKPREYDPNIHDKWKALTVKQPWADKILSGQKKVEVRNWQTRYRGDLIITASKDDNFERSGITVCKVSIVNVKKFKDLTLQEKYETGIPKEKWKNYNGCYGWILQDPKPVNQIPVKGSLGVWNLILDRFELENEQVRYAKNTNKMVQILFFTIAFFLLGYIIYLFTLFL
jgi:hypothetical protein